MGQTSIYPTGVTQYQKGKAYNGYTLYVSALGATLIDMSGRLVRVWEGLTNPTKPLPGGQLLATRGTVPGITGASSNIDVIHMAWGGEIRWRYNQNRRAVLRDGSECWAAYHHHDFERIGANHWRPDSTLDGNTLLLTHNEVYDPCISDQKLLDERLMEIDSAGNTVWQWDAHTHVDELGLDEASRKSLFANPMMGGDWIHLNAVSTLGPNRHYDAGDTRFAPENVLCSSRQLNIIFIIEKATGKIVWRLGPDYTASPAQMKIGQIIGQHNVHMIPEGLPGAGNILIFDNGSFGGYGAPNPMAPQGTDAVRRHYSRVVEIDPASLELCWEYMKAQRNEHDVNEMDAQNFFSAYISSAQRLPNGNTLIDQGAGGHFIEVTADKEIVWEYVNPFQNPHMPPLMRRSVYRAYRVPYDWAPIEPPVEVDITPPDIDTFRVPGSPLPGDPDSVRVRLSGS